MPKHQKLKLSKLTRKRAKSKRPSLAKLRVRLTKLKRPRLKAKTKRRLTHVVAKKSLIRRKHSKHVIRAAIVLVLTVCAGSLAFASVAVKPVVQVSVHTTGTGGLTISAPVVTTTTAVAAAAAEPASPPVAGSPDQAGRGSWYALGLPEPDALTCASRTFPRGTYLKVEDLDNGNTVTCLVNDYGPAAWTGRVIDLSRGSFSQVDSLGRGTIPVAIWVVPGAPSGFYLTVPKTIGQLGYNLCNSRFGTVFCETHRQANKF